MKTKFYGFLTLLLALVVQFSFAQEKTITGTVTDDSGPLPGVSIIKKGTTAGTETDFDGKYSIQANTGDVLVFSFVGMKTTEKTVGLSNTINVTLEGDNLLDEVVVVAYGTSTKEALTGSVTQVDAEDIEKRNLSNVLVALDGAAAGVKLTPANGQPGSSPTIRVRGIGSVNASNAPLLVVDGVEFVGSFSSLNSNDIASLTVLKDAASTSLYGSRAGNGVIIITTKKGRLGKNKFTLNVSTGFSDRSIPEYDRVGPGQYYELMWEALRNSNAIPGVASQADLDAANQGASDDVFGFLGVNPFNVANDQVVGTDGNLNPSAQLLYPDDLDWQEPLLRTGIKQNLDFSYSGATETTDYFTSLSYLKDEGYILNSNFERVTARINVNTKLNDWFKTGINLSGASSRSNNANDGGTNSLVNPFRSTRTIASIYPVFEHDPITGDFILDGNGDRIYDFGTERVGSSSGRHPVLENLLNTDRDYIFSVSARTYAEFKFLKNFTFTTNAAIDKRIFSTETFGNTIVGDAAPLGRSSRFTQDRTTVNYNQLLRYDKSFGNHTIGALFGHESFDTDISFHSGNRNELIVEGNTELINFVTTTNVNSETEELNREGYFTSVNYNYDNKYFLSGSFRRDASSRFSPDVRWGNFYSVGASWRIDKEDFMSNVDIINNLKLRASFGEVGNDNLLNDAGARDFFLNQALFSLGFNDGAAPGILTSTLGNPDLTWEVNIQSDVALEFGLFDNRISGTLEYYNRNSEDLLFNVPVPTSAGLDSRPENIGDLTNSGFEFDLNFGIFRTDNFSWDLNVNGATLNNEIKRLPQEEIINGTKKLIVGGDIFAFWLRDYFGVDPADGSALYVLDPELGAVGDADVRTINGTNVTTNQNNALFDFVGTATPDLFGAFTNTFKYKQFDLGITFTYQLGGKTYDTNQATLFHSGTPGVALSTEILDRWQQPGDITDVPRLDVSQVAAFGAASSRFLIDSDFLALRQVNLAYNFDSKLTDVLGVSSARIYANGENLFISSKRTGLDAGQNFNGTTQNRFTPSRTITLGINVTF